MLLFRAKGVSATVLPDLNTHLVVLAENPDGDGPRLEIQRAVEYTAYDREFGQDTYCLCTHWGATYYGGIRSYVLEGSTLRMSLDPLAQEALGVAEEFSIVLDTDDETTQRVRVALASILAVVF